MQTDLSRKDTFLTSAPKEARDDKIILVKNRKDDANKIIKDNPFQITKQLIIMSLRLIPTGRSMN